MQENKTEKTYKGSKLQRIIEQFSHKILELQKKHPGQKKDSLEKIRTDKMLVIIQEVLGYLTNLVIPKVDNFKDQL